MKTDENLSTGIIRRIVFIALVLIILLGIGVFAGNQSVNSVTIKFSDGTELNVITSHSNVNDILKENNIYILESEVVTPGFLENIDSSKTITITRKDKIKEVPDEQALAEVIESNEILNDQNEKIVEKIVKETVEIPFETITREVASSNTDGEKVNRILQEGKNGIKEITYKIKYQNDIEIGRTLVSEETIKEAVNKIVQVTTVTARSSTEGSRVHITVPDPSDSTLASKVKGIQPTIKTMNTSAYTASECGKSVDSPGYGRTASGEKATAWYTIAAGKGYPMGTIMYIPHFKSSPNGGWFVVQDRGSSISNNKIDIYMNTYNECVTFGRRNLECYIYRVD